MKDEKPNLSRISRSLEALCRAGFESFVVSASFGVAWVSTARGVSVAARGE